MEKLDCCLICSEYHTCLTQNEECAKRCLAKVSKLPNRREAVGPRQRVCLTAWHKYPEEKPYMDVRSKTLLIVDEGEVRVTTVSVSSRGCFWDSWGKEITYWAELPKPPEE